MRNLHSCLWGLLRKIFRKCDGEILRCLKGFWRLGECHGVAFFALGAWFPWHDLCPEPAGWFCMSKLLLGNLVTVEASLVSVPAVSCSLTCYFVECSQVDTVWISFLAVAIPRDIGGNTGCNGCFCFETCSSVALVNPHLPTIGGRQIPVPDVWMLRLKALMLIPQKRLEPTALSQSLEDSPAKYHKPFIWLGQTCTKHVKETSSDLWWM